MKCQSQCGAIFGITTTQISLEFFYLCGIREDTNCQSELKPVFIYTGIHMVTSCSIVCVSSIVQNKTLLLYIMQLQYVIHWSSQQ